MLRLVDGTVVVDTVYALMPGHLNNLVRRDTGIIQLLHHTFAHAERERKKMIYWKSQVLQGFFLKINKNVTMFSLIYTTFKVDRDYKVVVVSFFLFFHKHRLRELLRINTIYVLNKKGNFTILGQKKKKCVSRNSYIMAWREKIYIAKALKFS